MNEQIIAAFNGTIGTRSRSDNVRGNGDFKAMKAISKAGIKNITADDTGIMFGTESGDLLLRKISTRNATIEKLTTYIVTIVE